MWAEYVDAGDRGFAHLAAQAAIAERLWSPAGTSDVASMYARMEAVSRLLEFTGVQHRANYAAHAGPHDRRPSHRTAARARRRGRGPRIEPAPARRKVYQPRADEPPGGCGAAGE